MAIYIISFASFHFPSFISEASTADITKLSPLPLQSLLLREYLMAIMALIQAFEYFSSLNEIIV